MDGKLTTIYLIRHGEVSNPDNVIYGRTVDVSLNEKGFRQMKALGERLQQENVRPDIIMRSPLHRAIQSTETLLEIFPETPVINLEELSDTDEPALAGRSLDWLTGLAQRGYDEYSLLNDEALLKSEGINGKIESREEIVKRMTVVLETIKEKHSGKTVFIVGHGDPLGLLMGHLLHSDGELPSIPALREQGIYPGKGEAIKITFDHRGRLLEHQLIIAGENTVKKEIAH